MKAAFRKFGITILGGWPKYSPDLNPTENLWAWAEKKVRKDEKPNDTEQIFRRKAPRAVQAYPEASIHKTYSVHEAVQLFDFFAF